MISPRTMQWRLKILWEMHKACRLGFAEGEVEGTEEGRVCADGVVGLHSRTQKKRESAKGGKRKEGGRGAL